MLPLKQELEQRWLLNQYTDDALFELYDQGGQKFYFGMDPTADSLHLGNFVNFMNAVHLMRRGNICIPLVGGATGMIGDPGGKDSERNFLSEDVLAHNVTSIQNQIQYLINNIKHVLGEDLQTDPVFNNKDFYKDMTFLDFLREAGKYITVNSMMSRETVKKRIEHPDKSISYTEFSYMLIQGYDFYKFYTEHDCKLQIAGSDQWGNLTVGTELIRKKANGTAYGFTCPLILDSNGKKFGKSEWNAIFLDTNKSSPYFIYQYFLNIADDDVERFLKLFTFYTFDEITKIIAEHNKNPAVRYGQEKLASYIVALIAGPEATEQAKKITSILFWQGDIVELVKWLSSEDLNALIYETSSPSLLLSEKGDHMTVIQLLVDSWLASSNGEAKKLIQGGGVSLNEVKVTDLGQKVNSSDLINGVALLRKGKKGFKVIKVV